MKTPTARTIEVLKKQKLSYGKTEFHNIFSHKKNDLFGFIDLVYLDGAVVGVQCTSGSNHAARRTKILTECRDKALEWLRCRGVIQVRSWSKVVQLTKKKKKVRRWQERIEEISFRDFGIDL